jgi:colanic acid/amylovoran biosynthesis glycosyltransferase
MSTIDGRIAYMTGEYPRATDTFIQREIAALRKLGLHVQTFAVREPAGHLITDEAQAAESAATNYLIPTSPVGLLRSHAWAFFRSPRRYIRSVHLAISTRAPGIARTIKQLAYFAEAGVLAEQMRRRKLPHLHNHFSNSSCSVAMLAAEMGGFSFSFTMHGPSEFFEPKVFALDEKIRRAAFVACISYFCRSQAMVFVEPGQWEKLKIVHCGVEDAPRLAGEPARRVPRVPSEETRRAGSPAKQEKRRLLFVGRLAAVKGLPILLDAFAALRRSFELELLLAGDGPDRPALQAQCEALGIADCVRFLGYQSLAEVQGLLREADVFVLPSFAEGVPVVLMEAMSAGVPVVATRIAGIPELVEHERTGLLVPPGDAGLLAEQVARLLNDPQLAGRLLAAAKQKVADEFNVHTEAGRLFELFSHCLNHESIESNEPRGWGELPRGQGCRAPLLTT